MFWLVLILAIVAIVFLCRLFHVPKYGNLVLTSGEVKAGKSTLSFYLAKRKYAQALFSYKVQRFFLTAFSLFSKKARAKKEKQEMPLFYSNIPCVVKNFSPLTTDLINRKKRFRYKSVIFVDEASLLSDSMLFKDLDLNERLQLFNKLIGHETKGGYLFYNTQSVDDLHFSTKRCCGAYFYCHHKVKIPFFVIIYAREMLYSSDQGGTVNVSESTLTDSLVRIIIPKSIWKDFDCYCYSCLTDDLPVADDIVVYKRKGDLKARGIVSFREFKSIPKEFIKNETERKD